MEEQNILYLHIMFHCVLGDDLAFMNSVGCAKSMHCMQFYVTFILRPLFGAEISVFMTFYEHRFSLGGGVKLQIPI
jgi:hypothetical protein